jgi:hypothetical protein
MPLALQGCSKLQSYKLYLVHFVAKLKMRAGQVHLSITQYRRAC